MTYRDEWYGHMWVYIRDHRQCFDPNTPLGQTGLGWAGAIGTSDMLYRGTDVGGSTYMCIPLVLQESAITPYVGAFHLAFKPNTGTRFHPFQHSYITPVFQLIIPDEQPCFDLTQISTLMEQVCSDCLNVYLCFLVDGRYV